MPYPDWLPLPQRNRLIDELAEAFDTRDAAVAFLGRIDYRSARVPTNAGPGVLWSRVLKDFAVGSHPLQAQVFAALVKEFAVCHPGNALAQELHAAAAGEEAPASAGVAQPAVRVEPVSAPGTVPTQLAPGDWTGLLEQLRALTPGELDAVRIAIGEDAAVLPPPTAVHLSRVAALLDRAKSKRAFDEVVRAVARVRRGAVDRPHLTPAPEHDVERPVRATIGILTALPLENAAVRMMLTEAKPWHAEGEGGGRRYDIGRIAGLHGPAHEVVVALLPDMGNTSAAIRAMQLLNHFPHLRHLVMCGIAGGVPHPEKQEHDVRLGDVVVSNRNGVVQYNLIKEHPDGSKEHRHPPRPPDPALLAAVRHLEADAFLGERPWEAPLGRRDLPPDWRRPADNVDAGGDPITYPVDPKRRAGLPRVFQGTIAAADVLLKNAKHRDYLAKEFGVKAVEMEGAGVADASWVSGRAGYLVVRGICDYCDERKGDAWQPAAALAAAAYTRALIASLPATG